MADRPTVRAVVIERLTYWERNKCWRCELKEAMDCSLVLSWVLTDWGCISCKWNAQLVGSPSVSLSTTYSTSTISISVCRSETLDDCTCTSVHGTMQPPWVNSMVDALRAIFWLGSIDMPIRPSYWFLRGANTVPVRWWYSTAAPHLSSRPAGAHGRAVTGANTSSLDHAAARNRRRQRHSGASQPRASLVDRRRWPPSFREPFLSGQDRFWVFFPPFTGFVLHCCTLCTVCNGTRTRASGRRSGEERNSARLSFYRSWSE